MAGQTGPQIISVRSTARSFEALLDVRDCDKDSLKVCIDGEYIVVKGNKIIIGSGESDLHASIESPFTRRFKFSPSIPATNVSSELSSDGKLTIKGKAPPLLVPIKRSKANDN